MKKILFFFLITQLLFSCSEVEEFHGVAIRQYANFVIDFSSQYTATSWSANQVLGKENVHPDYGDNSSAWSPLTEDDQREYLVVGFDTAQTIHTIQIYETWYPGAIDTVSIRKENSDHWEIVYSRPALTDLPEKARIFSIYIRETSYLVDAVRIAINSPAIDGWNEIDAVAIRGQRKNNIE